LHITRKLFLLEIGWSGIRRNMRNRMTYPQLLGEQQECECDIGKGSTECHRGVMENYNVKQYAAWSDPPSLGCGKASDYINRLTPHIRRWTKAANDSLLKYAPGKHTAALRAQSCFSFHHPGAITESTTNETQ
jgi:hypothetical protein